MRGLRLLCSVALGALAAACGGGSGSNGESPGSSIPTPKSLLALKNFSSADDCAEFRSYAADALTEQYLQPFYRCGEPGGPLIACPVFLGAPAGVDIPASAGGETQGAPQPGRVSGT